MSSALPLRVRALDASAHMHFFCQNSHTKSKYADIKLISNQDIGYTTSVAQPLALHLGPTLHNFSTVFLEQIIRVGTLKIQSETITGAGRQVTCTNLKNQTPLSQRNFSMNFGSN